MTRTKQHDMRDVPSIRLRPLLVELIDRCGNTRDAAAYIGISRTTLHNIVNREREYAYRSTARLIILALHERRREDRRNGSSERFRRARVLQAQIEERAMRLTGY